MSSKLLFGFSEFNGRLETLQGFQSFFTDEHVANSVARETGKVVHQLEDKSGLSWQRLEKPGQTGEVIIQTYQIPLIAPDAFAPRIKCFKFRYFSTYRPATMPLIKQLERAGCHVHEVSGEDDWQAIRQGIKSLKLSACIAPVLLYGNLFGDPKLYDPIISPVMFDGCHLIHPGFQFAIDNSEQVFSLYLMRLLEFCNYNSETFPSGIGACLDQLLLHQSEDLDLSQIIAKLLIECSP